MGENRVQELCEKYDVLKETKCTLHLIGHLQTNKVRQTVERADMIQSVDSLHLAEEISRACVAQKKNIRVLVEVNIGREERKSGVLPEQTTEFCEQIAHLKGISLCGLMAIPPICEKEAEIRQYFAKMRQLFLDIRAKKLDNISMTCLSMGMSGDFVPAILEGATMIRVGSALFGPREYLAGAEKH